ncbi:hypothetical protein FB451DRAFT_1175525 [Mycena latifolia]|nr:hypothetical protein FB451DRAFT_1175525 [Mycena latifolia]
MGFTKMTKREKQRTLDKNRWSYVMVEGPRNSHYLEKPKKGQEPLVFLANNRTLIQKLMPVASPSKLSQLSEVPQVSDDLLASDNLGRYEFDPNNDDFNTTPLSPRKPEDSPTKRNRHRAKVEAQGQAWQIDVLPALVPIFLTLWHKTRRLRDADALVLPSRPHCNCGKSTWCKISVLRFTCIKDIETAICPCAPAPQQLLQAGFFPSAPKRPSFAVDVRVLEFAMQLFVRIAPNNTAWCGTIESFLGGLGFTLEHEGSLRKLFASSLEWYTHLRHTVNHRFDDILERTRYYHFLEDVSDDEDRAATPTPTPTPAATQQTSPPRTPPASPPSITQNAPPVNERGRHRQRLSFSSSRENSTSPTPGPSGARQKRRRDATPEPEPVKNPFCEPLPRTRPSEYLRRRCPACFGALAHDPSATADVFVCVDACFTQKRNTGAPDPPKTHPATHFISETLSTKMEEYVDGMRDTKPSAKRPRRVTVEEVADDGEDDYEHPELLVPRSVLDGCEASFKAADERRVKASTQFYDDTALMALLCRHDRVLWLVNMHSVGEKQFYVLLLLETLFQHLPLAITIGLLYDVACQLERSARKWGFLDRYLHRLIFAVAVFHAFGHEWGCQIIYHPRKRVGFGFTNGEGCERFWHSISHLIAHLRVSSYHHRLYTLDTQVEHADEANLFKLAEWNHRRALHSTAKRVEAQMTLKQSGHALPFLRAQWAQQVKAQTKPIARRSKTRGQKAVAAILASHDATAIRKSQVWDCEAAALDAVDVEDTDAIVQTKVALAKAREALGKAKDRLRRQELGLGVEDKVALKNLAKSKYFELRMNALAVKTRLQDRLRARKFERDRVERSSRRQQVSEHKLLTHTESAVKRREPQISHLKTDYNKLCDAIAVEIRKGRALARAIAPERIETKALCALDVDDAIWQDAGLQEDEEVEVPLWLSSDTVHSSIRAMLELDRANEEDKILAKERQALRAWFAEEWTIVNVAMDRAENEESRYQLFFRRERLLRLCVTWRRFLPAEAAGDTPWGPSEEELLGVIIDSGKAGRGEDGYQAADGDSEEELEDFDTLDALGTADVYRNAYSGGRADNDTSSGSGSDSE